MLRSVYAAAALVCAIAYLTAPVSAHDASATCQVVACAASSNPNWSSASSQPRGAGPYFNGILNDKSVRGRFLLAGKGKGKGAAEDEDGC
jgi:hypothetical protein